MVSCEKTAEPVEMPFGVQTRMGPKTNFLSDRVQISHENRGTSDDMTSGFVRTLRTAFRLAAEVGIFPPMRPFAKLLWTLVIVSWPWWYIVMRVLM